MEDPLWQCLSGKTLTNQQLSVAIANAKLNSVREWFKLHFSTSSRLEYLKRCPIVVFQGPTGCGKTSVLRCLANEFGLHITEFSETTDTTDLNDDVNALTRDDDKSTSTTQSFNNRKAMRFEHFVINSIRFNTLYPPSKQSTTLPIHDSADSEFDSDDEFGMISSVKPPPMPQVNGVIIHIESPLSFARTHLKLAKTVVRLVKIIKDVSAKTTRRVAVVFETLDAENDYLTLSAKLKQSLGIIVYKFNPVTKSAMKKVIESLVKDLRHVVIGKDTIEQIVIDCDGDIRACLNTLQLICNKPESTNSTNGNKQGTGYCLNSMSPHHKRPKYNHDKVRQARLEPSLRRDQTRSIDIFHVLGKIFYQKRLYPSQSNIKKRRYRSIDRPYPTENTTEHLVDLLAMEPQSLIAWLHEHYYRFCGPTNIEKAASFLEELSNVDTTSLGSTQTFQFFEKHHIIEQIQTHLAIEATVFSLYHDQSDVHRPSHKKAPNDDQQRILKASVESTSNDLYSFTRPPSLSLYKLVEDYQKILSCCAPKVQPGSIRYDAGRVLIDYLPYLNHMVNSHNQPGRVKLSLSQLDKVRTNSELLESDLMCKSFQLLTTIDNKHEMDFDARHEKLLEVLDELEKDPQPVFDYN